MICNSFGLVAGRELYVTVYYLACLQSLTSNRRGGFSLSPGHQNGIRRGATDLDVPPGSRQAIFPTSSNGKTIR